MNTIDLQIQSAASDGIHTPREIVMMAKEAGVFVIALTDHDTVAGIPEARAAGEATGVRVIPGIELSAEEHDIHILGYGFDYTDAALIAVLEKSRQSRIEGAKIMVEKFQEAGFSITWEDVLRESAGGSTIGRPHIVRAIMGRVENKEKLASAGVVTAHDFFEKYFKNNSSFYVPRAHISARRAIETLHGAGGVAIWSHPAIPDFTGGKYGELEVFLKELIAWGIDGIEVFNPSHAEDDVEFLNGLAAEYSLIRTAGSDFHAKGPHPRDPISGLHSADSIGDYETYGFSTEGIIQKLDEAIEKRRQGATRGA